jgi:hypothetical protein
MPTTPLPLVALFALACAGSGKEDTGTDFEPPMEPTDFEPPMPADTDTDTDTDSDTDADTDTDTVDSGDLLPPMTGPTGETGDSGTIVPPMPYPTDTGIHDSGIVPPMPPPDTGGPVPASPRLPAGLSPLPSAR